MSRLVENSVSPPLTPMLQQYLDIKKKYPGVLVLFRLGDFYELFFDDALKASSALSITLTRRGQKDSEDIPMCGIPAHAADNYIARLIKQGFKVAIGEQLETPEEAKKRGQKAIVKRDVVRIITPGTCLEDSLLDGSKNNFLVALIEQKKMLGIASVDISTGEFLLQSVALSSIESALNRLDPKEILVSQNLVKTPDLYDIFKFYKDKITIQPDARFDFKNGKNRLEKAFHTISMDVFGSFSDLEIMAGGALLEYVALTQIDSFPQLKSPKKIFQHSFLQIDVATRRSLELEYTQTGERRGSLLHTIDRTLTAPGGRYLARNLAFPLIDATAIQHRLNQVEWFLNHPDITEKLREYLKNLPDAERILMRISVGRSGPRDLGALRTFLDFSQKIHALLASTPQSSVYFFSLPISLKDHLYRALNDTLPVLARDGGFIATGYSQDLDALKQLKDNSTLTMAALQTRYIQETGIQSLKIKFNSILGYYIEITNIHKDRVPDYFLHRQTLVNGIRFMTVELAELQEKINSAAEKVLALELSFFNALIEDIKAHHTELFKAAQELTTLDMILSFSHLAKEKNYVKPLITQDRQFLVTKGRHPVVEQFLKEQNEDFTANDCILNPDCFLWLLTGPNMAGKSTYLRQNALIVIMAQMGCYVPAESATIGIVDKVFSRVGAADDLARGRSTFLVEMIETAAILNQATDKSFVILDEIGRGTSTYDGVSLAWATLEHLHMKQQCRTLFATHYHELTTLTETLAHLSCYTIKIKEWEDKIIFMHAVIPGRADKSYGIHVAQLGGMPKSVIKRAQEILQSLEKNPSHLNISKISVDHFKNESIVEEKLKNLELDHLSPKEALNFLYELKEIL